MNNNNNLLRINKLISSINIFNEKKHLLILVIAGFLSLSNSLFAGNWIIDSWNPIYEKAEKFIAAKQYDSALVYAEKALNIAKSSTTTLNKYTAFSEAQIGEIYYKTGDYEAAIKHFKSNLEITKETEGTESRNYASALNNLSIMLQSLGKYEEALPILEASLEIKVKTIGKQDTAYAYALNNIGQLYQSVGKYERAKEYYLEALALKKQTLGEDNASYGISLLNLAILQMEFNKYDEAIPNFKMAAKLFEKFYEENNPETFKANFYIAQSYIDIGEPEKASDYLKKAEKIQESAAMKADPKYAETLYYFGLAQWSSKNYSKAENLFLQAKQIVEQRFGNTNPLFADCVNNLGVLYRVQGKLDKAKQYIEQALALRENAYGKNHLKYLNSLHNYAGILNELGDFKNAKKKYIEAFDGYLYLINNYMSFLSESEKAAFYFSFKDKFDLMNNFILMHRDRDPNLLSIMYNLRIATKAFLLRNTMKLRENIIAMNDKELLTAFENWRALKETIAGLYSYRQTEKHNTRNKIDSLSKIADDLEKSISIKCTAFNEHNVSKKTKWEDIQKSLKKNEAAIEIIRVEGFDMKWTDSIYYVALIIKPDTKNNPEYVLLDNGYSLENGFINNYHKRIKFKLKDKYTYANYWEKIANKLNGISKVYISLDGVYNKINLNTLLKDDGNYVINDYEIIILTNTADLAEIKSNASKTTKNAVLVGYPKYKIEANSESIKKETTNEITIEEKDEIYDLLNTGNRIQELPETEIEINEIKNILKAKNWKVDSYDQDLANKSRIKELVAPQVLHIATHGYFLEDADDLSKRTVFGSDIEKSRPNPLVRSGLLLAGAENYLRNETSDTKKYENGMLTALETLNLRLEGTDLVILSACETGLGVIQNGEGVYGLRRAFQSAGAKSVIMSLWKIDDKTTRELMTSFYENWTSGETISSAFKNAQLTIKEKYEEPYYWGAFVLVGDGK